MDQAHLWLLNDVLSVRAHIAETVIGVSLIRTLVCLFVLFFKSPLTRI